MEETGGGQRYLRGVAPLKKRKYDVTATLWGGSKQKSLNKLMTENVRNVGLG